VCVCVCAYVCVCIHVCICIYICVCVCVYVYVQANNVVILANPYDPHTRKKVQVDYGSITKLLSVKSYLRSIRRESALKHIHTYTHTHEEGKDQNDDDDDDKEKRESHTHTHTHTHTHKRDVSVLDRENNSVLMSTNTIVELLYHSNLRFLRPALQNIEKTQRRIHLDDRVPPLNVCMCVCMYVYVCVYVRMCVCVCVCVYVCV